MPRIRWEAIASPDYIASFEARVMGEVEISDLANPWPEIQAAAEAECARRRMMPPRNLCVVGLHNRRADYQAVFPFDPLQREWQIMIYGNSPYPGRFLDDDERLQAEPRRQYQENKHRPWWRKLFSGGG